LFKHLLEKNLVAIGLYRLPGATDNKYPYCYTNPDPKTSITYKDRVFVLGKEIPNDLIIDVKQSNTRVPNGNTQVAKKQAKGVTF
jgi:predicted DNA-binding protein (MmcQ/YjbR family)